MRTTRALGHVEALARTCAEMATRPASLFPLRVAELWVAGPLLDRGGDGRGGGEVAEVPVALRVDVAPDDVAWLCAPRGAQHWANATRLSQLPLRPCWRSLHAPVWNHVLHRPALVWDAAAGLHEDVLQALHEGRAEDVRLPAPGPGELRARLEEERDVSLRALHATTAGYARRRWAPGKLEPAADAQHAAASGYLDVLGALGALGGAG
ncbi:DUF7711 family protein [Kineococcus sp. NUM-3379]